MPIKAIYSKTLTKTKLVRLSQIQTFSIFGTYFIKIIPMQSLNVINQKTDFEPNPKKH